MIKVFWKNVLFAFSVVLSACSNGYNLVGTEVESPSRKSIVVLYDNDVHCEISGYPAIAGLRDSIAASDTANTVLVSSGDYLQGGSFGIVSKGEYVVKMLNSSDYDVVGLGNHEFDYKMDRLMELSGQMNAAIVNSHLTDMQGNLLFKPYVVKKVGNKKIAFVGVLTPNTMQTEAYSFYDEKWNLVYDLHQDDVVEFFQKAVDAARDEGADYVIALSHVGEEEIDGMLTSRELVSKTKGVDVVLDAHSHSVIEENWLLNVNGDSVLVSQTGTKFENVGKLEISKDGKFKAHLIPVESISSRSSKVQATYDSVVAVSDSELNKFIANTEYALTINDKAGNRAVRNRETNIGDLVADAFRYVTGAQIGLVNGGAIRSFVNAGKISYRNVIDVMPYGNALCLVEATGRQILDALEVSSANVPNEFGGFLQVSGLRYEIDAKVANAVVMDENDFSLEVSGDRRVKNVEIEEADGSYSEIDLRKKYTVGLSRYLARESGENKTLNKAPVVKDFSTTDSDAIVEYLSKKLEGNVPEKYSQPQGRIIVR